MATAVIGLATAASALADTATPLGGSPLNVYVGERGQLQAVRAESGSGIFFAPSDTVGDAGFFLAFPSSGEVFGFTGSAGPFGLEEYEPFAQPPVTGSGTAADPLELVRVYDVTSGLQVTQTTTYVNGSQEFRVRWEFHNGTGASINFKALAAADFYFEGDDSGTGIFTAGPPRFIGGTNLDTGSSGGFVEVTENGHPAWSAYEALTFPDVWTKIEESAMSTESTFDDSVLAEPRDNAGGVEWDQDATGPGLAGGGTRSYEVIIRSAVPSALQLNPTNAGSRQGVPINITATALDSNGQPYAGKTLHYSISGPNAASGSATLSPTGSAVITDPGKKAGTDTVTVFLDFNNNGTREPAEPQASAQATFVDSVPPNCTVKTSGTLVGGGESGKPLVIEVKCGEAATVTMETTLTPPAGAGSSAAASKAKKIKLKPVKKKVKKGKKVAFKIKIPKSVAHRYAGKTLKAKIKVTAKDKHGNKKTKTTKAKVRLAKLK
ncbi:MAG TPA: Ig-like domain-containing protein [Solirubrobacterales bacterium]